MLVFCYLYFILILLAIEWGDAIYNNCFWTIFNLEQFVIYIQLMIVHARCVPHNHPTVHMSVSSGMRLGWIWRCLTKSKVVGQIGTIWRHVVARAALELDTVDVTVTTQSMLYALFGHVVINCVVSYLMIVVDKCLCFLSYDSSW